jgi:hypothetical protein
LALTGLKQKKADGQRRLRQFPSTLFYARFVTAGARGLTQSRN